MWTALNGLAKTIEFFPGSCLVVTSLPLRLTDKLKPDHRNQTGRSIIIWVSSDLFQFVLILPLILMGPYFDGPNNPFLNDVREILL